MTIEKVSMKFETNNAAFDDDMLGEIEATFSRALDKIKDVYYSQELKEDSTFILKFRDTNGNTIGDVKLTCGNEE